MGIVIGRVLIKIYKCIFVLFIVVPINIHIHIYTLRLITTKKEKDPGVGFFKSS